MFRSKTQGTIVRYRASGPGIPRWSGWGPVALSSLFLLSAAYYEVRMLLVGQVTTSEIVRLERAKSSRTLYAFIKFQTPDGTSAQFRQSVALREHFEVGDRRVIRYLPMNLQLGRIISFSQFWFPLMLKPFMGLILLAIGVGVLRGRFFGLTAARKS